MKLALWILTYYHYSEMYIVYSSGECGWIKWVFNTVMGVEESKEIHLSNLKTIVDYILQGLQQSWKMTAILKSTWICL